MSPADKRRLVCLSLFAIVLFFLLLSYIPSYLYLLFFLVVTCIVCYYKAEELELFGRLGLNPHRGLTVASAVRRWLPCRAFVGVPAAGRNKNRSDTTDGQNSLASANNRNFSSSAYRRDATFSDSTFSPRSILMGSYLGKAGSPPGPGRPAGGSGGNLREQLRERLIRPNHGVPTPNRRLSFGDPVGAVGRFTITPQRHYPLQQIGTSPVGVFPPAQWDSFRKKNILTQRNTPTHSPVTVKIARPDNTTRSPFCNRLSPAKAVTSPEFEARADPCSRETVLNVLRASRKRPDDEDEDDDDERAREAGQRSKRRRNDSGGSSQSVFEPLLANGVLSHIVPKPGSLKRGMNVSVLDESVVKRSRTSSMSSVSGCPASCGKPGSDRNPIRSSYSSSLGCPQRTLPTIMSSSLFESPGSPQSQTPVKAAKKPREEEASSPNSVLAFNSDKTFTETALGPGKWTPMPDPPVSPQSDSGGSSGKRKRKIQLVSKCRSDQITLPPPPELGYTITVKDMDMEKKATLNQIQKDLEDSEPEKPVCGPHSSTPAAPSVSLFPPLASSVSAAPVESSTSLASLSTSAAVFPPAPGAVSTVAPPQTIDLTVTPSSTVSAPPIQTLKQSTPTTSITVATSVVNPLLESLKSTKSSFTLGGSSLIAATSAATSMATPTPSSDASTNLSFGAIKSEPSIATPQPLMPSAFAQILAQPLPSSSATPKLGGGTPFGFLPTTSAPTSSAPTAPLAPNQPSSSTANPSSVFKPIFGSAMMPASTAEVKPTQTTFTPIFGNAVNQKVSSASSVPATRSSTSLFGGITNNQSQSVFGSQTNSLAVAASASTASNPTPALFGGLTNSHTVAAKPSSSASNTQNSSVPLFAGLSSQQPMPASVLSSTSSTPLFGGQTSSQPQAASVSSSSTTLSSTPSLFTGWSTMKSSFQFSGSSSTAVSSEISTSTTNTNSTNTALQFGALKQTPAVAAPPADSQNTFTFGQSPAPTSFTGFGMANNKTPMTSNTPATQATFGSSVFSSSTCFANPQAPAPNSVKPFTFGAGVGGGTTAAPLPFGTPATTAAPLPFGTPATTAAPLPFGTPATTGAPLSFGTPATTGAPLSFGTPATTAAPLSFGTPATTAAPLSFGTPATTAAPLPFGTPATTAAPTFGNSTQPAFGGASTGFAFGNTSALPVSAASVLAPTFTFGAAPATPQNSATSGGFNFTAGISGAQFGTPAPSAQKQGFSFGAGNTDNKPAFGASTPAFGTASGPIPFGSPGTPIGGFGASAFGTPSATFSIGSGSKTGSSRQRLQARRQHTRKK